MLKKIVFIAVLIFGCTSAYAATDFNGLGLNSRDMEIAQRALAASEREDWQQARQISQQAGDKIVYKIILWREFKEARSTSSKDIMGFLDSNNNWPLRDSFKKRIGLPVAASNPNDGWRNLGSKARDMLEAGQYTRAYNTLKSSNFQFSPANRAEALWLTGWIGLRYMKKPEEAAKYFETMFNEVKFPVSKSRAAYWAGRAYEAMKNDDKAYDWYREASRHYTWYYGQLAALRLEPNFKLELPDYPPPDYLDAKNFISDERIRAAKILSDLGDTENGRLFVITYMQEPNRTVSDYLLIVLLAQQTTNYEWAVMAGKKAAEMSVQIPHANYPILSFNPEAPEKALVMAITRQESMLNRLAQSPVGASGMMQLMPTTAANVAKMMGVAYNRDKLWDKDYNMTLGSYYLSKRVNDFNGSYILAVAAYNAGIGNVSKWIKRFGDPRTMNVYQVIDWVELIPFVETRNYVQRVMESTQVYRARINGGSHKLLLMSDLKR